MNKKSIISLLMAAVMMLSLMAGCKKTEQPSDNKPSDNTDTNKPSDNKKVRTDIIVGDSSDLKTLDPHMANDGYSARAFNQIYDALLKQGPNLEILPGLAESYENKSDTEIIFHIRKGVKFHNGDELKASDVKFSIDRMVSSPSVQSYFASIDSCAIIDDYTVSVKTKEPFAPLLFNLAGTYGSIVSEKAVTEAGDKYNENPIGTGPMKFKEWKPNDHITFVRNDDYWKGQPKATSVTIRVIPEASMRTIALENGEIDFIQTISPVDMPRVEANDKLKSTNYLSQSVNWLSFNCIKAPFDNVKVRQALSYAIDKETMIEVVLEGRGQAVNSMLAPDMPGADNELNLYPYDVEKAKALLAEAGHPNGFKAKLVGSGEASNKAAQMIQSDFAKLNVELDIEMMEFGALLDYLKGDDHELHIMSYGAAGNPDSTMSNVFYSKSSAASGNRAHYASADADKLIDQAKREMDLAKRNAIYKEAQSLIMKDAPVVPLFTETKYYAMNKNLDGVVICMNAKNDFYNAVVTE